MSMHLVGPGLTTTSTRRRKKKLTDNQYTKMCIDWTAHNKQMKRIGAKTMTLEDYIAYRQGKYKPKLKGAVKDPLAATSLQREVPKYPSGQGIGVGFAKPANVYTGGNLLGIATMHKSNMVPVFSQSAAEEISKMRRG